MDGWTVQRYPFEAIFFDRNLERDGISRTSFLAYREVCIRHPSASIHGGGISMGLTTEEQGGPREESVLEKRASITNACAANIVIHPELHAWI